MLWSRRRLFAGMALPPGLAPSRIAAQPASQLVTLAGTEQQVVWSRSGSEYRILLSPPVGEPPPDGWPVLYLLDGNAMFPLAYHVMRSQGPYTRATGVAPALIVGIGYPTDTALDPRRRAFDYTPAPSQERRTGEAAEFGGADAFLDFVESVLKPQVARSFPVDAGRQTLFGHSYGGLFVLHALFSRPMIFRNYLAISPSLWFGEEATLAGERGLADRTGSLVPPRGVFIAVGGEEQAVPAAERSQPGSEARAALVARRAMVDRARALAGRLAPVPGLHVTFVVAAGENHASVVPTVLSQALRFALAPVG